MKRSLLPLSLCTFVLAGCIAGNSQPKIVRLTPTITSAAPSQPPAAERAAAASAPAPAAPPSASDSLYKRLGGYDAISAVTDDFLRRMLGDRQLSRYFVGMSQGSRQVLRQHLIEFLCVQTGGPCSYVGRDIDEVHTGLGITRSDWDLAVNHLVATLDTFKVPATEKQQLLGAVAGFKEDIVGK